MNKVFYVSTNETDFKKMDDFFNNNKKILCGALIHKKAKFEKYSHRKSSETEIWDRCEVIKSNLSWNNIPRDLISVSLDCVLKDEKSFFLSERYFNKYSIYNSSNLIGPFSYSLQLQKSAINALSMINKSGANSVFIQSTPHDFPTWVLSRVAEAVGLPVYIMKRSALPWRYHCVKGIEEQAIIRKGIKDSSDYKVKKETLSYINKMKGAYADAMPEYEKKRSLEHSEKFFSIKGEIKNFPKRKPSRWFLSIASSFHKWRLYKEHNECCVNISKAGSCYIIFFLHYQPERTSLPEGGDYSQQYRAILELSSCLPQGWCIVVKEHPSMFRMKMNPWVRPISFYRRVVEIPNVHLCELEADNFDLIDESKCVATLTGTCGFEAICRGIPVLTFGVASYSALPGVFRINNRKNIVDSLERIQNNKRWLSDDHFWKSIKDIESESFTCENSKNSMSYPEKSVDETIYYYALNKYFSLLFD